MSFDAENGRPKAILGVAGQAILAGKRTVRKLTLVWIAMAGRAVIGTTTGIGTPMAFRRVLGPSKTRMAGVARGRIMRRNEWESGHGMPIAGQ